MFYITLIIFTKVIPENHNNIEYKLAEYFDIASFENLFKRHYKFLVLVAYQISKDEAAAEDIVQDFFIHFWNRRNEVQIETSFQSYATRAVKNLSLTYLKKIPNSVELTDQISAALQSNYLEEEEALQFKETADEKVLGLVNLLPEDRKKVFLQYVVDGLSYADIAKTNNISINTVKTQMKRAYAFLKAKASEDPLSVIFIAILLGRSKF
ncbi:RNA polymerase sigma-70 factor [Pedobacter miscanthi]|uniref:RNA polymerase sigma factor n=1 Tax=Pedobacter miscanthi TaxID=2259170 RepID=UPI0029318EB3|nr:RNA polymerase sigma-70 factor [Pedobacter miscanthi]